AVADSADDLPSAGRVRPARDRLALAARPLRPPIVAGEGAMTSQPERYLLDVRNVTMRFGGLTAVKELIMEVPRGALYGLIGPNGAGKTTIFNVLTGVYAPTE